MEIEWLNPNNVQYIIVAIAFLGALSLPYISIQLWRTTDLITFSMFTGLFGMLCIFVAFVGGGSLLGYI